MDWASSSSSVCSGDATITIVIRSAKIGVAKIGGSSLARGSLERWSPHRSHLKEAC
jgi:hypothetical protein